LLLSGVSRKGGRDGISGINSFGSDNSVLLTDGSYRAQ